MYELIFTNLTSGVKIQEWWFAADVEKRILYLDDNENYQIDKVKCHCPCFMSKEYFRMFWKCLKREKKYLYIPEIGT